MSNNSAIKSKLIHFRYLLPILFIYHIFTLFEIKFQIIYGGHYASSCSGHPSPDFAEEDVEGVKRAAIRRLKHELGIAPEQMPIEKFYYLTRVYHCDTGNGKWGQHEICYILVIQQDFVLKANSNEISELSFIPKGEMNEYIQGLKAPLEPIFNLIYKQEMIHLWWKNLTSLGTVKNHNDILKLDNCNTFIK